MQLSLQIGQGCRQLTEAAAQKASAARAAYQRRRQQSEAGARIAVTLAQSQAATPPTTAPLAASSNLVWHSGTAESFVSHKSFSRETVRRPVRRRDWEMALVGGAVAASLLMLAFGLFSSRIPDSPAAIPALTQPTAVSNAMANPAMAATKSAATPTIHALPQSDEASEAGPTRPLRRRAATAGQSAGSPASDEADDAADEVVVRHFTPVRPVRTSDGVKHISDGN